MASEVYREKVYGNFRKRGVREKKTSTWRDERPGMSEAHCAAIRKLPCSGCLKVPAGTIHHLKSGTGERGMSVRSTDKWGVPACPTCHEDVERAGTKREVALFQSWGIDDVHAMADALWSATGDIPRMTKIVIAHKTGGGS